MLYRIPLNKSALSVTASGLVRIQLWFKWKRTFKGLRYSSSSQKSRSIPRFPGKRRFSRWSKHRRSTCSGQCICICECLLATSHYRLGPLHSRSFSVFCRIYLQFHSHNYLRITFRKLQNNRWLHIPFILFDILDNSSLARINGWFILSSSCAGARSPRF